MSYQPMIAADLQGYSGSNGQIQDALQKGLEAVFRLATERAGLDWTGWQRQTSGDGVLAVLPAGTDMRTLVEGLGRELNGAIREHNRTANDAARLQLRMAVHHGPVQPAALGFSQSGPVLVTRLCNSDPLRSALRVSGASLGVIVSETVFRGTIEEGMTSLEPADLRRVRLAGQGRDEHAWIWIPGLADLTGLPFDDGQDEPGTPPKPVPPPAAAPEPQRDERYVAFPNATINAGTVIGRDQNNHFHGGPA